MNLMEPIMVPGDSEELERLIAELEGTMAGIELYVLLLESWDDPTAALRQYSESKLQEWADAIGVDQVAMILKGRYELEEMLVWHLLEECEKETGKSCDRVALRLFDPIRIR